MKSIALLGVGRWGQKLLRILSQKGALSTVWTRNLAKYRELQAAFSYLRWTDDIESIWQDSTISAVVIATPAPTHPFLVEAALQAGKDVFCEKPVAFSLVQLKQLDEIAQERGLILMGGHILHYHPATAVVQRLLSEGRLGKLLTIHAERTSLGRFPLAEDALWGLAIHDIGLILSLLNASPLEVQGIAQATFSELAETIYIHLSFPNEIKAHIMASWLHPERRRRLTLIGTEGMVAFSEDSGVPILQFHSHQVRWEGGTYPKLQQGGPEPIPLSPEEPLAIEMDHFLTCLRTRQSPLTGATFLLPVTAVVERLARSLFPEKESPKPYFVHPTALIDEDVEIGEGTKIWHFSHILRGSRIGKNCVLGQNVVVGPFVKMGNNCKIQNNVSLYYGVELEDGVLCGPSCVFTNDKYPRAFIERRNEFLQTRVKKGATIGANATIMCGTTIGKFAMVGAGAVVTQDVPDHALVVGNPARQVGWVCECGETLTEVQKDSLHHCSRCDIYYTLTLKGLEKLQEKVVE
ncbi:MAG: Gfo/Idh/MocA family oxidoreductase [Bacteroidia bacterium]|nr:Gfo/Idh/MocA family oxidoreductase [Bacteroidia bacterium]